MRDEKVTAHILRVVDSAMQKSPKDVSPAELMTLFMIAQGKYSPIYQGSLVDRAKIELRRIAVAEFQPARGSWQDHLLAYHLVNHVGLLDRTTESQALGLLRQTASEMRGAHA